MQSEFIPVDYMADNQTKQDIANLNKSLAEADGRTLRLGTRLEELRDFVHTDVNVCR
jgi:hypothetical protein